MQALVLTGLREVSLLDRPVPVPGPEQVLLEVLACGICGSDVHGFLGEEPRRQPGLCLGHETVGRIGSPHPEFAVGERVAVNPVTYCEDCPACRSGRQNHCPHKTLIGLDQLQGAFAKYTVISLAGALPLAPHVSDALACLCEPLACAVHLLGLAPVPPLTDVLLFGGGTLGSVTLALARQLGYRVTVVEPSDGRRAIALALGAEAALAPDEPLPGGFELTIDCTGVTPARRQAIAATRPGGTVLMLGTTDTESTLDWRDIVRRELRLQTSYGFTPAEFRRAKELLERVDLGLDAFVQSKPLSEGQAAFDELLTTPGEAIKVVLRPGC